MDNLEKDLKALKNKDKGEILSRFFKTGPGQYGEGDIFWGITVPETRAVARKYISHPIDEIISYLSSPVHEVRLAALMAMVGKYKIGDEKEKEAIVKAYLANTEHINNWDLVDLSCYQILGDYIYNNRKKEKILIRLAKSRSLWERRIAIVSTMAFIRQGELDWTFKLAEIFLDQEHDLMHKATGWLLREAGKKDEKRLKIFLDRFGNRMPRTALRYAIERFADMDRKHYLESTR